MDKETKRIAIRLAYASSLGISMVIAIFGSLFIGVWLDGKFGTGPYLTVLFLLIGIAAGFRNIILLIKRESADLRSASEDKRKVATGASSETIRKGPPSEKA